MISIDSDQTENKSKLLFCLAFHLMTLVALMDEFVQPHSAAKFIQRIVEALLEVLFGAQGIIDHNNLKLLTNDDN